MSFADVSRGGPGSRSREKANDQFMKASRIV